MEANEVRTRLAVSRLDEHGIIRTTMAAGAEETLADAQEIIRANITLGGGRSRPILVDMRGVKSQEREARRYYAGPEVVQAASAVALLVGSRVSMLIANFFITVVKSIVPTRLFTNEAEAVAWLRGFLV